MNKLESFPRFDFVHEITGWENNKHLTSHNNEISVLNTKHDRKML